MYNLFFKRIIDFIVTSVILLVSTPLIIIIALLVKVKLGTPILFKQTRPGLHGKPFIIYKFRSMTNNLSDNDELLPEEMRLTKFGCFLRSTSLDELPELWNILKGEMSLVGPRPLLMKYLPLYSSYQARRHNVRPGLTGWAQINGRNLLAWDEKFKMDIWYVENQSFFLDMRILLLTLRSVLNREGINAEGNITMPPFNGDVK